MPVLLTADQAPRLQTLLNQANVLGLELSFPIHTDAADRPIQGLSPLTRAGPAEISFLSNPKLHSELTQTQAAAVVLSPAAWDEFQQDQTAPSFQPVLCDAPYAMYALL